MLVKGVKPREVLCQYMARVDGPSKGKDLNVHFSDLKRGFIGPISMLGDMICVMGGVALAAKMQKRIWSRSLTSVMARLRPARSRRHELRRRAKSAIRDHRRA